MSSIDFATMTTDELLKIVPETESNVWEFKAASIFDKSNFGLFKKQKLGKVVSSFANSGGGYLLLGKRDGEEQFDPVPSDEGRSTMEDHLSLVISQSVIPHFRDFEIFRVPISGTNDSVLVVEFSDSPVAPHQSVADTNYFYRLPGHSVPAPHFHLELLRSRFTKAVVEIADIEFQRQTPTIQGHFAQLNFVLRVKVENISLQSATDWGIHVKSSRTDYRWTVTNARHCLTEGTCVRGEQQILLPSEKAVVTVHVQGEDQVKGMPPHLKLLRLAEEFRAALRPASQNFVGRELHYHIDSSDMTTLRRDLDNM